MSVLLVDGRRGLGDGRWFDFASKGSVVMWGCNSCVWPRHGLAEDCASDAAFELWSQDGRMAQAIVRAFSLDFCIGGRTQTDPMMLFSPGNAVSVSPCCA